MLTDFLELKRYDRRAAPWGFTPAPIPKLSWPKSSTNQLGPRLHQTPLRGRDRVERGPTPQDAPNERGVQRRFRALRSQGRKSRVPA